MTVDIKDPARVFEAFVNDREWWGARQMHLSGLENGFEKWLVTEWLLWMRAKHSVGRPKGSRYDWVGIEAKAGLTPDHLYGDQKKSKRVDFWWALEDPDKGPWNFVELKVIFNNSNADKLFRSAGWDLWYLSRLAADDNPKTVAVIVVGHGFSESTWKSLANTVTEASDGVAEPGLGGRLGSLHWRSWQKTFP